jgi:hypothetical protein
LGKGEKENSQKIKRNKPWKWSKSNENELIGKKKQCKGWADTRNPFTHSAERNLPARIQNPAGKEV